MKKFLLLISLSLYMPTILAMKGEREMTLTSKLVFNGEIIDFKSTEYVLYNESVTQKGWETVPPTSQYTAITSLTPMCDEEISSLPIKTSFYGTYEYILKYSLAYTEKENNPQKLWSSVTYLPFKKLDINPGLPKSVNIKKDFELTNGQHLSLEITLIEKV